ncbi:MAG: hypothetical protein DWQ37_09710 [Planctomycetota bacterium]|nr:MAG: hypothetical protein DWQ37_09710 [Planctomycetota bacterium]
MEILASVLDWLRDHAALTTIMLALSVVVAVASLWIGHYFLTTIRPDYFAEPHKPFQRWYRERPVLWWTLMIGKNVFGVLFILAGLIMFFTPGQGVLTLILGMALVDVPGKQRVMRAIIQRPTVLNVVNRLRDRAGKPPLDFSDTDDLS